MRKINAKVRFLLKLEGKELKNKTIFICFRGVGSKCRRDYYLFLTRLFYKFS